MKLVNIFAAASILTLAAVGCTTTTTGSGTGGYGGGTAGTGTGGTGAGGSGGTAGTGTGGTGTGGTGTGGTGTGGTGTGGSGGGSCTSTIPAGTTCDKLTTKNPTCDTCMQGSCCNEMNTCFGDTTCSGLYLCIGQNCQGITDQTQFNNCVTQNCAACASQAAQTALNAFAKCQQDNCTTQCGGGAGGAPSDGGI
jgi:hypothetical protein